MSCIIQYIMVGMLFVSVPILPFVPAESHTASRAIQAAESYFNNRSTSVRYGIHTFYYNLHNAIEDIEIKLSHLKGMVKTLTRALSASEPDSTLHKQITEMLQKLNTRISEYETDLRIAQDYQSAMGSAPTIEQLLKILTKGE